MNIYPQSLLRKHLGGTDLGKLAQNYMDQELVPDDVVIKMVEDRIAKELTAIGLFLMGFREQLIKLKHWMKCC